MAQSTRLRDQAERCRRLARDSTDLTLGESLLKLAEEYFVRADHEENDGATVWRAGSNQIT